MDQVKRYLWNYLEHLRDKAGAHPDTRGDLVGNQSYRPVTLYACRLFHGSNHNKSMGNYEQLEYEQL